MTLYPNKHTAEPGRRHAFTRPPTPRPAGDRILGAPRKLGHVNFLTGAIHEQAGFYARALGMTLTREADIAAWQAADRARRPWVWL